MQDGKLHLAPLSKNIERVLDVGTGTGIWAIDFADEFPNTTVLGTDLSPIQPALVPPNCRFEVDDCTDEWVYPENYFDYVHIRTLFGCIEDWDSQYAKAYKYAIPLSKKFHIKMLIQRLTVCCQGIVNLEASLSISRSQLRSNQMMGRSRKTVP